MPLPGFTSFDTDPFFEGHRDRMGEFGDFSGWNWLRGSSQQHQPLPSSTYPQHHIEEDSRPMDLVSPFRCQDLFRNLSGQMNNLMRRMDSIADRVMSTPMETSDNTDSHSYMQSSVYTYKNTGEGDPQTYEAHHSRRTAPGGVVEEKKALRDTQKKVEKMSVGRHIKDKGHVIEKTTRTDTNETHQRQNLYGLTEAEIDKFKADWKDATSRYHVGDVERRHKAVKDDNTKQAAIGGAQNANSSSKL